MGSIRCVPATHQGDPDGILRMNPGQALAVMGLADMNKHLFCPCPLPPAHRGVPQP